MLTANSTVPTPTVPPSSQPITSTVSSMQTRTRRRERPVRRARPVISPSRGPGPKRAPMYMPLASPQSKIPPSISGMRHASGAPPGSSASVTFIELPTRTTLLTVPRPGHCRSGIQPSSTTAPTRIETVPIASPVWKAMPWWSTSQGSRPSPERTWRAPDAPYSASPR